MAGTDWSFPAGSTPALSAPLGSPVGIIGDSKGNIYTSDIENNLVLRIAPDGMVTVVAGNGRAGFSGDGGPATSASLNMPTGLALDAAGNLYIADSQNARIRKATPDGMISTAAGNGLFAFSGDGGPAVNASLGLVFAIAVDRTGNLYLGDNSSYRIRKITAGIISTIAGTGNQNDSGDGGPAAGAAISGVLGLAADNSGSLYFTTYARLRKISATGIVTTVAGGGVSTDDSGPAASASLLSPYGIAIDPAGNIYVTEWSGQRVRKVTPSGTISTVAGVFGPGGFTGDNGPASKATLFAPNGVALDAAGNLYIADQGNRRIRRVNPAGTIASIAGNGAFQFSGDGGPATSAALDMWQPVSPNFVPSAGIDSSGNLYFADEFNHRVRRVAADGTITTVAGNGFFSFDPGSRNGGLATDTALYAPNSVTTDPSGNFYFGQNIGPTRKVTPDGTISTVAPNGSALAFDGDGLYLSGSQIRRVAPDGTITVIAGNGKSGFSGDGGPAADASFFASAIALDTARNMYIADTANRRIRKIAQDGTISTVAGNGGQVSSGDSGPATSASLSYPSSVSIDTGGNLYIADPPSHRVRKVAPDGTITTVAGTGSPGFSGDGGPATNAALNYPSWVLADAAGNLYIGDGGNNRIRKILAAKASYSLNRANLDFTAIAGASRAASQSVDLSAAINGLSFNASASDPWISVTPSSGVMPASVQVTADPGQLPAGNYQGTVTISAPSADPAAQTIPISFTVAAANPPKLAVDPPALTLSLAQQSSPVQKSFFVSNTGSGSLAFSASVSSDKAWLRAAVANNTATPASPGSIDVTADPAGLSPGSYSGSVTVTSPTTGEAAVIPVTLAVTGVNRPSILLSQTGLSFRSVVNQCASTTANCSEDLPQCFAVLNAGQGTLDFTVSADVPWIQVGRASCPFRAVSSSSSPPDVVALLRAGNLAPGNYEGHVLVTAPQADNSPQSVLVKLTVVSSAGNLGPIVRPTGLAFAAPQGQTPGSLDVYMYNLAQQSFHYASSSVFLESGDWFTYSPPTGDVKASQQAGVLKVYPDFSKLTGGTYHGGITLATVYGLQPVEVLAAVLGGGNSARAASKHSAAGCVPSALGGVFTLVEPEFNARIAQPFPLELYVLDDCGAPVTTGSVVASFSNGDPGIQLVALQDGRWAGTWMPQQPAAGNRLQITVHISANSLAADLQRSGNLQ